MNAQVVDNLEGDEDEDSLPSFVMDDDNNEIQNFLDIDDDPYNLGQDSREPFQQPASAVGAAAHYSGPKPLKTALNSKQGSRASDESKMYNSILDSNDMLRRHSNASSSRFAAEGGGGDLTNMGLDQTDDNLLNGDSLMRARQDSAALLGSETLKSDALMVQPQEPRQPTPADTDGVKVGSADDLSGERRISNGKSNG